MKPIYVNSYDEFKKLISDNLNCFIVFYKGSVEAGKCGLENAIDAQKLKPDSTLIICDTDKAGDIHPHFGIKVIPAFVSFKKGQPESVALHCHSWDYYLDIMRGVNVEGLKNFAKKPTFDITVYSTQTCPYCIKLKAFLKDNNISFKEVDVAKEPQKMVEVINRSGQKGVPQIDINGSLIVGFDEGSLRKILGI